MKSHTNVNMPAATVCERTIVVAMKQQQKKTLQNRREPEKRLFVNDFI